MSMAGKVFLMVFFLIAAVSFVGFVAYVESHNGAANVTISTVQNTYYNTSNQVNQSINQSLGYASTMTKANEPFPLLIIIFTVLAGLFVFLVVVKKR